MAACWVCHDDDEACARCQVCDRVGSYDRDRLQARYLPENQIVEEL